MNFDILVVGAGPAGLNAALVAAQAGATVGLVDDNPLAGGQIWRQGPHHPAGGRARAALERLNGFVRRGALTQMVNTRVVQALPGRQMLVEQERGACVLGYNRLIVANGARERFLPYPGWTLPGVTGVGGLQALVKGGVDLRGERVVIAGSGPLLLAAAVSTRARGGRVVALVEQAAAASVRQFATRLIQTPTKLFQALVMRLNLHATPYWCGAHIIEAIGESALNHVRVQRGNKTLRVDCDRLACAYGLVPNTSLAAALGCKIEPCTLAGTDDSAIAVDGWQATTVEHIYAAGECTGVGGMELAAVEGAIAAHAALGDSQGARSHFAERERYRGFAARLHATFALAPRLRELASAQTTFCRCEDVTFGQVAAHRSWREAKLHTRCGMGSCQGTICGTAATFCFGWSQGMPRPPLAPTRIDTMLAVSSGSNPVSAPPSGSPENATVPATLSPAYPHG